MILKRLTVAAPLLLSACGLPFVGGDAKSECDQIAAQAIETDSASRARDLAARATECYARLAS